MLPYLAVCLHAKHACGGGSGWHVMVLYIASDVTSCVLQAVAQDVEVEDEEDEEDMRQRLAALNS